ncbi:MAG: Xaa-Pro peptidase family protein [Rhodobacteraceae bacterium]|nr:Xaa-Pro peptidase family protein [Paracoccaceae bacterium]
MSQDLFDNRMQRLREGLAESGFDAAAIVPGANLYYLSGVNLHLMERPTMLLVFADGSMRAVIPELERAKWLAAMPGADTHFWQDSDGFDAAFAAAGADMDRIRIGVEGQRMRVFEYEALKRGFPKAELGDAEACIAGIRLCKDAAEIRCMETAIGISERALASVTGRITAGMSEARIQAMLKNAMLDEGAEGFAFEPIVLAGENSANPHGSASDTCKLSRGQGLLFDFGASFGGYHADITRTFFCETVSEMNRDMYDTVLQANRHGRAVSAPGVTAHEIDESVTGVMRESPFAEFILHRTGHGLGLYVHEEPQVMMGNSYAMREGVVITIEPGLYRPGEVGIRIEDDVVITAASSRSLTSFDRELTLIG